MDGLDDADSKSSSRSAIPVDIPVRQVHRWDDCSNLLASRDRRPTMLGWSWCFSPVTISWTCYVDVSFIYLTIYFWIGVLLIDSFLYLLIFCWGRSLNGIRSGQFLVFDGRKRKLCSLSNTDEPPPLGLRSLPWQTRSLPTQKHLLHTENIHVLGHKEVKQRASTYLLLCNALCQEHDCSKTAWLQWKINTRTAWPTCKKNDYVML